MRTIKEFLDKEKNKEIWYHGSNSTFDTFNSSINWFSTNKKYAKEFGPVLYSVELNPSHVFKIGPTDRRVYSLIPTTKPFKLSREAEALKTALKISEEEWSNLIKEASSFKSFEEEYKMNLFSLVRTSAFRSILEARGYDSILAVERSRIVGPCWTLGVFDPNDINIISKE